MNSQVHVSREEFVGKQTDVVLNTSSPSGCKYRAVDISFSADVWDKLSHWQVIWGTDIWINNIPTLKMMILANIIIWIIMWVVYAI